MFYKRGWRDAEPGVILLHRGVRGRTVSRRVSTTRHAGTRFRDEFLSMTLFASVAEARVLCEAFRREYNEERAHQSLGYLTPNEFKEKWLQKQSVDPGD
jgi:transposase InsO family protein